MYWFRRRRKRASSVTQHYLVHKEPARAVIQARLALYNQHYQFAWNRVSIRNQRRCWGSCTSLKNLNFSYKLYFLPTELLDYIIVHELCHLAELNHGRKFWELVAEQIPDYQERMAALRRIEQGSMSAQSLQTLKYAQNTSVE